jgi:flagellar basal-body rod modification protein FlgD
MAVDNVQIDSSTGIDGNSYTSSVSNDELTNDDFLRLLLEEMKMQDPTKPMDSQKMMDTQLQMSTIEANMEMSKAMTSLQTSYANSALSTAAGLIGNIIEDGTIGEDGLQKSFKVETVENKDGEMFVNARQLVGLIDSVVSLDDEGQATAVNYDTGGNIYEDGVITGVKIKLDEDGRFDFDEDGKIVLLNGSGDVITDSEITDKYKYNGTSVDYANKVTTMAMSSILKIR